MSVKEITLWNTLSRKKEKFVPQDPKKVRYYSCGPTVYGLIHIGNLRAALTSDLVYRALRFFGYSVTFVRNYTDVDDKIITKSHEEKCSSLEVSEKYIQEVEKDYALAKMLEPTHKTKVTDHMKEILQMVGSILDHGNAYIVDSGEVLYSIDSFPSYGKLSKKKTEDLQAGARVEINDKKKNPFDFTLWKPAKKGEPSWDPKNLEPEVSKKYPKITPGRPGWHIECSAMAKKWLGDQIDLHHGGEDLIFPHHENEIAQSEACTKKEPYSRFWLHNGFLNLDGVKMSKSLGNVVTARNFLETYGGEFTRYFIFSAHYRSLMDFSDSSIHQAMQSLERVYSAKKRIEQDLLLESSALSAEELKKWKEFGDSIPSQKEKILVSMQDDLNTPEAFSHLFILIRTLNSLPEKKVDDSVKKIMIDFLSVFSEIFQPMFGVFGETSSSFFQEWNQRKKKIAESSGESRPSEEEILGLIEKRNQAKKDKNYALSDEIRNTLLERGVLIKDSKEGTTWEYKS